MKINLYALRAIYLHEMDRFRRTLTQSVLSPIQNYKLSPKQVVYECEWFQKEIKPHQTNPKPS